MDIYDPRGKTKNEGRGGYPCQRVPRHVSCDAVNAVLPVLLRRPYDGSASSQRLPCAAAAAEAAPSFTLSLPPPPSPPPSPPPLLWSKVIRSRVKMGSGGGGAGPRRLGKSLIDVSRQSVEWSVVIFATGERHLAGGKLTAGRTFPDCGKMMMRSGGLISLCDGEKKRCRFLFSRRASHSAALQRNRFEGR